MYRPFFLTSLMIASLIVSFSGCSGKTEVAQSTPPPAASTPSSSNSGTQANMMAPPSDDASMGPTAGEGSSMGDGYIPPPDNADMPGFNQGAGMGGPGMLNMSGQNEGMGNSAMGGMDMGSGMGMGGMPMGGGMGSGMGMGGMGMGMPGGQFAPPEDPAPAEDADYLTKGRYAFSIGKEKEAIEYARAFAIASPEGTDVLRKTKWFAAGLRPITSARFAVGVVLEAPAATTDFKPMGSKQLQGGGGGGMSEAPGSSGGAQNKNVKKEHALYDLTGTFGEAVVAGFEERWSAGNFGSVYNDVEKFVPKPPIGNNGMGMGMAMGMGMGGMPGGMGGMEMGSGEMGMGGMGMGGPAGSGNGPSGPRAKIMPGSIVVPGLVYIGTSEKQADLMKKAEDRGVDLVFLFDVKVSAPNRLNRIVQNEAKVRVVSLKGDPLARSSELLNTEVERALLRASGDDEVAKATDKFYAQFDSKVKFGDMPALKPEHAKARLVQVLSNSKLSKLEKLFEVSLYHSMKLITDDEKLTACLIVMEGSEGESVANGRPEDKQAVLDTLLPTYK